MTFDSFIEKYNNKAVDFDGAYGSQCVDLFRQYNKEVLNISQPRSVAGAKDFWTNYASDPNLNNNFKKIPNTRELIPIKGDVMIWGASYGPWGHIAMVTEGTIDDFTCFSQNDPTGTKSIIKHYSNFNGVLGVLRPKNPNNGSSESESDNMDELQQCKTDLSECKNKQERYRNERDDARNERDQLKGENADLQKQVSQYAENETKLTEENEKLRDDIDSLEAELANCEGNEENSPLEDVFLEATKEMVKSGAKVITNEDGQQFVEVSYKLKE